MFRKWLGHLPFGRGSAAARQLVVPPGDAAAAEPFDSDEAWRVIVGKDNSITAIDIGGANDLQPHWDKLIGITHFIVYEPHDESYLELVERQKTNPRYKNFRYLNEALSGSGGSRTLYKTNIPTGSSLYPIKPGSLQDYPTNSYVYPITKMEIATKSLRQSLDELELVQNDIVKLDTQGSELEILRGLDDGRFAELLAIECEIGIIGSYDTKNSEFKDYLSFLSEKGFVLFDMRVNRFLGNAMRLDAESVERVLGPKLQLPPIAQRVNEVDAVFFRDPRILLENGLSASKVRRLIALLLVYNFMSEAVFTVMSAKEKAILNFSEAEEILSAITSLRKAFECEAGDTADWVERHQGMTWAQYMWVPYPSS